MSSSIKHVWASPDLLSRRGHWFSLAITLLLVLRHPTCASCVAWMYCRMSSSIKHVWASPKLLSRRGHWFSLAITLLLVLRHSTCVSYIPWMCCKMSKSIKHEWACPDLSIDRLGLYTFLHSLRSNFSPSRPLQLCFVPACETSFAHDINAMQSTQKSVEGATALFVCLYSSSWMIGVRDKKHSTCLRNGRGCAAWALISYCNHVVVSDRSSNLCIMCCMNVL